MRLVVSLLGGAAAGVVLLAATLGPGPLARTVENFATAQPAECPTPTPTPTPKSPAPASRGASTSSGECLSTAGAKVGP